MTDQEKTKILSQARADVETDISQAAMSQPSHQEFQQNDYASIKDDDPQERTVFAPLYDQNNAEKSYSEETTLATESEPIVLDSSGNADESTLIERTVVAQINLNDSVRTVITNPSSDEATQQQSFVLDRVELVQNNNPSSSSQFTVDSLIKDRFQLIECLGAGGMGMVFKAKDIRKVETKARNPYVAIKVLNPDLVKNDVLVAALQRECDKAQSLSHPNIITVYDFDRDGDHVFMSMEYLVGQPLTQIIKNAAQTGGMKLDRAWPIIQKMGEALAYAHKMQIVHSDFKPANVFITENGDVKVLDFGIAAKLDHADENDKTLFDPRGEGAYTLPYASLEMLNGAKADKRDDIYAFGLVVYELLTGKHPYHRNSAAKVFFEQQRKNGVIPVLPILGLNRKQWRLLKSAIELLEMQRPKDLEEWLRDFAPKNEYKALKMIAGLSLISILMAVLFFYYNESALKNKQFPSAITESMLTVHQGDSVVLNGSASKSANGEPLRYDWHMLLRPAGSVSDIQDYSNQSAKFIPDVTGVYTAELTVTDTNNSTASKKVDINVLASPAVSKSSLIDSEQLQPGLSSASTSILHQASSNDGTLYAAAGKAQYSIGEALTLTIRLTKSGYLRVAYISANGQVSDLFPNQYQSGKVKSNTDYHIPPSPNSFKLEVTGPIGVDKVVAVFSETQLPKVKDMVNNKAELSSEFNSLTISSVLISYEVVKK